MTRFSAARLRILQPKDRLSRRHRRACCWRRPRRCRRWSRRARARRRRRRRRGRPGGGAPRRGCRASPWSSARRGSAELARSNIERNGLDRARARDRGRCRHGRSANCRRSAGRRELRSRARQSALPIEGARHRGALTALKAAANAMPGGDLDRWVRFMAAMARPGGTATMIHRAEALAEVLGGLRRALRRLLVFRIYPREGGPAIRVLVQGIKGSRAPVGAAARPDAARRRATASGPRSRRSCAHGAALDLGGASAS